MNTARVNAAAGVILAAQKQGKAIAASLAMALESAQLLQSPETAASRPSPWERAVGGLNALVDADIAFHVEPDGHISNPFGDEHIEWDHDTARWRLVHDDDDGVLAPHPAPCRHPASPDCVCPAPAPGELAEQRHLLAPLDHVLEHLADEKPVTVPVAVAESSDRLRTLLARQPKAPSSGACDACGDGPEKWCPDCAACREGCHKGHDNNPCAHSRAPWAVTP